jgi:hypothetical protein
LLKRLRPGYADADDLWTQIGGLAPVAQHEYARYNLLKIWEDFDESA